MQKHMNIERTNVGSVTVGLPRRSDDAAIESRLAAPSHIYFIYSAGLVKIGYSTEWRSRVERVCNGCPHPAALILVIPGDEQQERGFHAMFAAYRERGEWFRCEGKVREFLQRYASPEGREILELAESLLPSHGEAA